jgi:hypothetical protein
MLFIILRIRIILGFLLRDLKQENQNAISDLTILNLYLLKK